MALDMRTAIGGMIEKWRDLGHDLGFGIGIAHGFATLGTIGFEGRFDYAAIGTVSNVASRLCDEAKPGQILISPRVRLAVDKAVTVEPVGEFTLKGIRRPMMTYNVFVLRRKTELMSGYGPQRQILQRKRMSAVGGIATVLKSAQGAHAKTKPRFSQSRSPR